MAAKSNQKRHIRYFVIDVQGILDHKNQRPLNGPMTPEMDPKWSPQLPLIDLSPFPDLLKHYSPYI